MMVVERRFVVECYGSKVIGRTVGVSGGAFVVFCLFDAHPESDGLWSFPFHSLTYVVAPPHGGFLICYLCYWLCYSYLFVLFNK